VTCAQRQPPSYTFGIKHSQYAGEIMNPALDEESAPCIAAGSLLWMCVYHVQRYEQCFCFKIPYILSTNIYGTFYITFYVCYVVR